MSTFSKNGEDYGSMVWKYEDSGANEIGVKREYCDYAFWLGEKNPWERRKISDVIFNESAFKMWVKSK